MVNTTYSACVPGCSGTGRDCSAVGGVRVYGGGGGDVGAGWAGGCGRTGRGNKAAINPQLLDRRKSQLV